MEEKIKAIYCIKDKRNDKVIYVGQTKDYENRKYHHFHSRRNRPISNYMFDNGIENFDMLIIEKLSDNVDKETMKIKEQEYIEKFNTIENGLNKQISGNKEFQKEHRKEYLKIYSKKWKEEHEEYLKTYNKKWIEEHEEYIKEYRKTYSKKWKDNHPDYFKEYQKTEKFKEIHRESNRKWTLKQKEKNN